MPLCLSIWLPISIICINIFSISGKKWMIILRLRLYGDATEFEYAFVKFSVLCDRTKIDAFVSRM